DPPGLTAQVERFTPFALQLARLVEERPGDLAARAALADFYKFRGFVSRDREQKAALYREALGFNPANENVRDLLAELERGGALMSATNPFEALRLDPTATEEQIVAQADRLRQRAADEAELAAVRQAVQALTGRAEDRLLHALLTPPRPAWLSPALERF